MDASDRRSRRDEDPMTAMRLQLEACAGRATITALVVADSGGELLAETVSAGVEFDAVRFAALLPFLAMHEQQAALMALGGAAARHRVIVRKFNTGARTLYLGVVGANSGEAFAEVLTAARGCERILS